MKSSRFRILAFAFVMAFAARWTTAQTLAPFQAMHTLAPSEGSFPEGGLVFSADGQLYGTANTGGPFLDSDPDGLGYGSIFRLLSDGSLQIIKAFSPAAPQDGLYPTSLMRASDGRMYGTTDGGGQFGAGVIYRLNADGSGFTVLHAFNCAAGEGGDPWSVLTEGPDGALYGTTNPLHEPEGCEMSSVYKINKDGTGFTVLKNFNWFETGAYQFGPVVVSGDGSVYGTTYDAAPGFADEIVFGTVFKLSPSGELTRLKIFNHDDGAWPWGGLIRGPDGAMYGTASAGGLYDGGTIFRVTEDGEFTTLYNFETPSEDNPDFTPLYTPNLTLVNGGGGKLYGMAFSGGAHDAGGSYEFDLNTGEFTPHHDLDDPTDGSSPWGMLTVFGSGPDQFNEDGSHVFGTGRHLYGANSGGGETGAGVLFGLLDITVTNRPPYAVARALPNPVVAADASGATVTLNALGSSDPDFDTLNYAWGPLPAGASIVSGTLGSGTLQVKFPRGTSRVPLAVNDGSTSSSTFVDVVVQDLPPTIGTASDISASASGPDGAIVTYTLPTATDDIDGDLPVSCAPASGSLFSIGSTVVTCSATDSSDNLVTTTFTVTVTDAVNVTAPGDMVVEATGPSGAVVSFTASAANSLGSVPVECAPPSDSTFPLGQTTVTCTATDTFGNTGSASFTVTVQDTIAPDVTVPDDITAVAATPEGATVEFSPLPSATDAVSGEPAVFCTSPLGPATSGATFPVGTTTVTCTATDGAGNTGSASFDVTVQVGVPDVTVPANMTPEATGPDGAIVTFDVSATDSVEGSLPVTCSPASGSLFPLDESVTVTCSATNSVGNTGSKSFKVKVVDTTGPFVYTHGVITASESPLGRVVFFQGPSVNVNPDEVPYATDIVDGEGLEVTCTPASGSLFPIGTTVTVCTATDARGNQGSSYFEIVIRDGDTPEIAVPAPITEEATAASGAPVTFTVTATDLSDPEPTISCDFASGSVFPLGTTTVTCTATDHSEHSVSESFTVTVVDTTPPVIGAVANVTTPAPGPVAVTYTVPTAYDLVSGATAVTCLPASGSTFPIGATTVTCTSADARGNSASKTFTVEVTFQAADTTPPVITVPPPISVTATGSTGAPVTFVASALDDTDGARPVTCTWPGKSVTFNVPPVSTTQTFPIGTTTVTCTASDLATPPNTATKTFTVTVNAPASGAATAHIRRSATFNGTSRVEGSVQTMMGYNVTFNSSATLTGDLLVAGTPNVNINGSPNYGGTIDGTGAVTPTGYTVTINSGVTLGHVIRRTNPLTLPTVAPPPPPTGTRSVNLNSPSDNPGDFATIANLTLNSNVGPVAVPPGAYGTFTANTNTAFVLGVAGSTTPTVYSFQTLNLNSSSALQVVGPVVITVGNSVQSNGTIGAVGHPDWLTLRISNGGLTLNTNSTFDGYVVAPNGPVTLNSNTRLTGGVVADELTMNSNGRLVLVSLGSGDAVAPVITVPANLTIEATSASGATATFAASAVDGVDGDLLVTCTPASGAVFPLGANTVTCKATDVAGNVATKSFSVTVRDTTPPAITVPANLAVETTSASGISVTYAPATATDAVTASPTITYSKASGAVFPLGTTTVTVTAKDAANNTSTKTFTVTVTLRAGDTTPPVITVPASISVTATGSQGASVTFVASALDNVNGARPVTCTWPGKSVTFKVPAASMTQAFPIGTTTVTCTASDLASPQPNTATKTFAVTVVDKAPLVTVPADITINASSTGTASVNFLAFAKDSMDGNRAVICTWPTSKSLSFPAGSTNELGATFPIGSTDVACSATDTRGNKGTAIFTITVTQPMSLGKFVVFSAEQTWLFTRTKVLSGDVGANGRLAEAKRGHGWDDNRWDDRDHHVNYWCHESDNDRDSYRDRSRDYRKTERWGHDGDNGRYDSNHGMGAVEVRLGSQVTMPQSSRVVGDTVWLESGASVFDVIDNDLINSRASVQGTINDYLSVPIVKLPSLPSVSPGKKDVTVNSNATVTLAPGQYRTITVRSNGTLILSGGVYHVEDFDIDTKATVRVKAATEVRIKGELDADERATITNDPSAPNLRASQIKFFVAGDDRSCRHSGFRSKDGDEDGPTVVHIGEQSTIKANIYAPSGTIWIMANSTATGAFIGERVRVGSNTQLTLDSAF